MRTTPGSRAARHGLEVLLGVLESAVKHVDLGQTTVTRKRCPRAAAPP
ncbi:unnamed protein product [Ectocarpus sp. CCAP 1310/34]|nr:unnamed protein product [Ectocarpus sp. CCAP 1310/34]